MYKISVPIKIEKIIDMLHNSGYKAYAVGGCVRDSILGTKPNDWDICTNALPQQVMQVLNQYKIVETGIKHGTVTVIDNTDSYEITTFRSETTYSDNRHPDNVIFENNVDNDLSRRDFTINAIAYNKYRGIIDLFNGIEDINNKVIRTVGNPDIRFKEDALRILRALRFSAVLGFTISTETKKSIHKNKELLKNIAFERIWNEFKKLLCGKNAVNILREFYDVIGVFISEIMPMVGFNQNNPYHCYDVFEHTLHALEFPNDDIIIKMSVLLHDIGKPSTYSLDENNIGHFYCHANESYKIAENILTRLRVDNNLKNSVLTLVKYHDIQITPKEKSVLKTIRKLGSEELFEKLLIIKSCDAYGQAKHIINDRIENIRNIREIYLKSKTNDNYILSVKQLKITGYDILQLEIPEGKIVGIILNKLLEMVINRQVSNNKSDLLEMTKLIYADLQK